MLITFDLDKKGESTKVNNKPNNSIIVLTFLSHFKNSKTKEGGRNKILRI